MMEYLQEIWNSLPPWLWSKIMIIVGLMIIFISLNVLAKSAIHKRK